jgi:hypothetical protein
MTAHQRSQDKSTPQQPTPEHPTPTADDQDVGRAVEEATHEADDNPNN